MCYVRDKIINKLFLSSNLDCLYLLHFKILIYLTNLIKKKIVTNIRYRE